MSRKEFPFSWILQGPIELYYHEIGVMVTQHRLTCLPTFMAALLNWDDTMTPVVMINGEVYDLGDDYPLFMGITEIINIARRQFDEDGQACWVHSEPAPYQWDDSRSIHYKTFDFDKES